jgi:hypothetical protein
MAFRLGELALLEAFAFSNQLATSCFLLNLERRDCIVILALQLVLQRNEVIALVNLLARLSESVNSSVEMGAELHKEGSDNPLASGADLFSQDIPVGNRNDI